LDESKHVPSCGSSIISLRSSSVEEEEEEEVEGEEEEEENEEGAGDCGGAIM
jgi:hypothetical protein